MDSNAASDTQVVLIHSYLAVMATCLLAYDHIITIADEIAFIWRRPKHVSSFLFLLNRYIGLLGNAAATAVSLVSLSPKTCASLSLFHESMLFENEIVMCTLLSLRTVALYGRDKRVIAFMVAINMCLAAVSTWALIGQHSYFATDVTGCYTVSDKRTAIHLAGAWEALLVFDTLVFFLTLRKTFKTCLRSGLFSPGKKLSLMALVCRDGAIYYAAMVLANLANILSYYVAPPLMRGGLSTFASCVSITLLSRLMLNLHKTADAGIFSMHVPQDAATFTTHLDSHWRSLTDELSPSRFQRL
ncbi:hypothetical protein BDN67DRAFT_967566 [Paxillus ammoniavirescens]|nr:hypothetical protein BDN67DRAFT_967566 [Paxillus ammoniavirescens]